MKAKAFMLSFVIALTAFVAQAREVSQVDNRPVYETEFEQDPAARWFIELRGSTAMLPFGDEASDEAGFVNRISPIANLSSGRWHSPYFATCLRGYAWNIYSFDKFPGATEITRYQNLFGATSLEFMFDLINYLVPYRENRILHPVLSAGLGGHMKFYPADDKSDDRPGIENDYSGLLNSGLTLKFRLGEHVDFNLECQTMVPKSSFQGTYTVRQPADVTVLASADLTFKLGKVEFQPVTPMGYDPVNDLNGQVSPLRAQNAELNKRPVSRLECPEAVPTKTSAVIKNVVVFRIGNAKIDENQMISVYNSTEAVEANGGRIYIVGYADEQIGNAKISISLSQHRAEAVRKALVDKYGINSDNIITDYKGDTIQPFAVDGRSRITIIDTK